MARLVIVAGPALLPLHHLPSICSPTWPGLSLWQVPPFDQLPQFSHTNLPHLYTQPSVIPTFQARLVIVAGPASSHPPTSSSSSLTSFSLPGFHLLRHRPRLATVASLTLPPASPLTPPHRHTYFPHPHHSGPACHCGRSRQDHCDRSRLLHPHHLPPHLLLSLPSVTPY